MDAESPNVARVTVPLLIGMTVRDARGAGHVAGVVVPRPISMARRSAR